MTTTNYDKEKALEKIESFVSQRSEERVELENKIISLIPRMNDLHDIVKKCLDNDISTNLFFAEKEPQKVVFFKTNEGLEKYFGVLGDVPHHIEMNSIGIEFRIDFIQTKVEVNDRGHVYLSKEDREVQYKYYAMKSIEDVLVDKVSQEILRRI